MQVRNLVGFILAASLLAGCTITVQAPPSQPNTADVATVVAQTLQAAQQPQTPQQTPFASPVAPGTGSAEATSATPAASGTPATATATSSKDKVTLSITANSNCRKGPGGSYGLLTSFTPGAKLEVVSYSADNNYYQVKVPNSQETCWVWGQYAEVSGNATGVPTANASAIAASAAAPSGLPNRPGALTYQYNCSGGTITVDLGWNDSSDNEAGFRVYRGANLIATLAPNSTSFSDSQNVASGATLEYSVTSFNDAGESAKRTVKFAAC